MRLKELFLRAGLDCPKEAENINVKNIVPDSRKVRKGSLFVCLAGQKANGHDYVDEAIKAEASAIIVEQVRDECVGGAAAFIVLDNTRRVAALLYDAWYGNPSKKMKIIGVTGTNGKTSVTTMLYEMFTYAGHRCGLIGTVCRLSAGGRALSPLKQGGTATFNMTTPDPEDLYSTLAIMARDKVEYVFMEVSSHALALHKVDAIEFELAIFTNLTHDHLDFHKTMEEYYKAKKKLFSMSHRALIVVGDEYGKRLAGECPCHFSTISEEGDFYALDIKRRGIGGSSYLLRTKDGTCEIDIPLLGDFAILNSLTSASAALMLGLPIRAICYSLAKSKGVSGRMERVELPTDDFTVVIDYAHTPDALEKLLLNIRALRVQQGHIVLLFGCGGERDREKRKAMAAIASRLSDFVIVTSDNSRGEDKRQIFSDILKGIDKEKPYQVIEDRRAAIEGAVMSAASNDIIVLAGKGHEKYEIDEKGIHPFDEIKIVKEAFKKRCD